MYKDSGELAVEYLYDAWGAIIDISVTTGYQKIADAIFGGVLGAFVPKGEFVDGIKYQLSDLGQTIFQGVINAIPMDFYYGLKNSEPLEYFYEKIF